MNDPIGTVRINDETGQVALCADPDDDPWLITSEEDRGFSFYKTADFVEDWRTIYRPRPKYDVGTVLKRELTLIGGFEIAIKCENGWTWIDGTGTADDGLPDDPYDDEDGAWEVVR